MDEDDDPRAAIRRAHANPRLICQEAGAEFFDGPHPPRSTLQVAGLPHGPIELTAVAVIGSGAGSGAD